MAADRGTGRRRPGWSTQANEIVNRVFAYGTFRAGESARAMIAGHVATAAPATLRGRIYAFPEDFPGFVDADDGLVVGELIELRDLTAAFALLDAYEGDEFTRVLRQAQHADGRPVWAWCYALTDPAAIAVAEPIPDGDWVAWRRARE